MFCRKCGVESSKDARFCKNCGEALASRPDRSGDAVQETTESASKLDAGQLLDKVKALPKKALISICGAVVVLLVIIYLVINGGKTIDLNNYLLVEVDGYNGYAVASVNIDWDSIERKYGNKLSFTSQYEDDYRGFFSEITPVEALQECAYVVLDQYNELANGDVIAYTWEVDEEIAKYINCKIRYKDDSHSVSGLEEVDTFDAFSALEVTFSGEAPNGGVDLNYNSSELSSDDFYCNKSGELSNGDTIVISIDSSRLNDCVENSGKIPETLEKEYTVAGLTSYLSKINEINDTALSSLQQQASDVFDAQAAKSWGEGESLENFIFLGNYLLSAKDDSSWGNSNALYLIYKAQVRNIYANDGAEYNQLNDVYWYISFDNLKVEPDGNLIVETTNYNTVFDGFKIDSGVDTGWFSTKSWYYYGYQTLDELYKNVVTANLDAYNYEDNVSESITAEAAAGEAETNDTSETNETGYILQNSDSKLLTNDNLKGLSAKDCKIARNEIYARHGRKFKDQELQSYFDSCDWYEGTVEPDDFEDSSLSDIEIANRNLIVEYEKQKGYQ